MESEVEENTRGLHMSSKLLGVYPYVLIQLEPTDSGGRRMCIDYDLLNYEEVILVLSEALEEIRGEGWIEN